MSTEPRKEIESLNADEMDVQELDDAQLEDAAGGTFSEADAVACSGYSCGNYWC